MIDVEVDTNVVVEALDKSFRLEDFRVEDIDPLLFKWELGGITDPLGQLIAWLWDNIQEALSDLANDIWGWLTTIRDQITLSISATISSVQTTLSSAISTVSDAINSLSSSLSTFITYVEGAFSSLETAITSLGTTLSGIVSTIQSVFSDVLNQISTLASSVQSFVSTVINQISALATSVYQNIASFGQTIVNTISGIQTWISQSLSAISQSLAGLGTQIITAIQSIPSYIQTSFAGLTEWLQGAFTTISQGLAQFGTTLTSFGQQILSAFNSIGASLAEFVNNISNTITQAWNKVYSFFEDKIKQISKGLQDVGTTLSGFVNPLVEIKNWIVTTFQNTLKTIGDGFNSLVQFLTSAKDNVFKFFESASLFLSDLPSYFENIRDKLMGFGNWLWANLQQVAGNIWNSIKSFGDWVKGLFVGAIGSLVKGFESVIKSAIQSPLKVVSDRIKNLPEDLGEVDIATYLAMGYSLEAAKQMAAIAAAEATGEALGDQEVEVAPLGLGGKIRLRLGSWLKSAAKYIRKIVLESLKYSFAALVLWTVEPAKYYVFQRLRNALPIQLPTITEMIEYTRRRMPTQAFEEWLKKSREVMESIYKCNFHQS